MPVFSRAFFLASAARAACIDEISNIQRDLIQRMQGRTYKSRHVHQGRRRGGHGKGWLCVTIVLPDCLVLS